jgi:uncharacterized membrane protein
MKVSVVRTSCMIAAGLVTAIVTGLAGFWVYAASLGWAVACTVYVLWIWLAMARMDGPRTKEHAETEDPARSTADTLLLIAAVASIVAMFVLLGQAHAGNAVHRTLLAALAIVSVAVSWFFVHTLYSVRYAVLYYDEDDDNPKAIDFNQDVLPRFLDFAYLAFTVGMTFQVSDTDISSQRIRAAVLRHMLLSYLFGAVIVASTVNLVASLAG